MNRLDKIAVLLLQSLDDAAEEEVSEPSGNTGELPVEPFDDLKELPADVIGDRCDATMRPLEEALDKAVANARALLKGKTG